MLKTIEQEMFRVNSFPKGAFSHSISHLFILPKEERFKNDNRFYLVGLINKKKISDFTCNYFWCVFDVENMVALSIDSEESKKVVDKLPIIENNNYMRLHIDMEETYDEVLNRVLKLNEQYSDFLDEFVSLDNFTKESKEWYRNYLIEQSRNYCFIEDNKEEYYNMIEFFINII